MENGYKTIILLTDASKTSHAAEESAFDLAKRDGARVLVVDTVRPPSLASHWFTSNAQELFEMVRNDKQERLEKVAERFRDAGIQADAEMLCGKTSEEVARVALNHNADLVIRYIKGEKSRQPGRFGNTARNLMRICHCPLLLVGDKPVVSPRVLACVNAEHEANENQAILQEAQRIGGESKDLFALYCWKFYGGDMLQSYMDDNMFQQSLREAEHVYHAVYERFLEKHDVSAFNKGVQMENGDPVQVIPDYCRHQEIDVVVMSSASQNHPIRRLLGSTIESVLDELPCSLLVVKSIGFKSPIKPSQSTVKSHTA